MKLYLVLLIVGIHFIRLARQELDFGRYPSATKKCHLQNIEMRAKVMEFYSKLNELCGITTTPTPTPTEATTTPTTTVETTTVACSAAPTLVTLSQLFNAVKKDHFYVTTSAEVTAAEADAYTLLASPGKVSLEPDCPCGTALAPVYRLFNPNSNDHFYTTSSDEETFATTLGYVKEGIKFYCSAQKGLCGATLPLFRFLSGGDHIYVTDPTQAVQTTLEGIACYIWPG